MSSKTINQIIYEGIVKAFEIIVSCHDKNCSPRVRQGEKFPDNLAYINHRIRDLQRNVHIPFTMDVYLDVDNKNGISSLLIERWTLHYEVSRPETKEMASSVKKRVGIMMRTLYCYVRLLPSFQLSTKSKECPISFRIHVRDLSTDDMERFVTKTTSYQLPRISTPSGNLSIRLKYIDANVITSIYDYNGIPERLAKLHLAPDGQNSTQERQEGYHGRRHSLSHEPIPIPSSSEQQNSRSDSGHRDHHRRSLTSINTVTPPSSRGNASNYTGLRSPTQPSTSLVEIPEHMTGKDHIEDEIPDIPTLSRHQSKSWTPETPLTQDQYTTSTDNRYTSPKGEIEVVPHRRYSGERFDVDLLRGESMRTRSLSKGERVGGGTGESRPASYSASRHGRPPQHVSISVFTLQLTMILIFHC